MDDRPAWTGIGFLDAVARGEVQNPTQQQIEWAAKEACADRGVWMDRAHAAESSANGMHRRAQAAEAESRRLVGEIAERDARVSAVLDLGREIGLRVTGDDGGGLTPYGVARHLLDRAHAAESLLKEAHDALECEEPECGAVMSEAGGLCLRCPACRVKDRIAAAIKEARP